MKLPTAQSQVTTESLRSSVACEQPFVSCLTATNGVHEKKTQDKETTLQEIKKLFDFCTEITKIRLFEAT